MRLALLLRSVAVLGGIVLSAVVAAPQSPRPSGEEGIPVTDSLVKEKCSGCHPSDDRGNLKRISWERATPEAWSLALQRMILLNGVELTAAEQQHVIQYLSTHHGLAPEEAKGVIYDVERRIHEETGIPKTVMTACARCHNFARVLSWRRSADDWKQFSEVHGLRYNFRPIEEVTAFITRSAPLHTPEWAAWNARIPGKTLTGRWLVTASVLGRVRYIGEMQVEPGGGEAEFDTSVMLRSIMDGTTVVRSGHGIIYGSYAWRGLSKGSTAASTPDDPSNEAREVTTSTPDELSADGRWFWGQYQELGFDIHIQRASTDATLLAIDRLSVKTGSLSQRIRLFGDRFPTQVLLSDINLGPGVAVRRIVSHNPKEIVADIDVARNAPIGKHKVSFGRSVLAGPLALYDRVDYIKVNPESATAAFGEPTRSRGYQQFEAIGYQNGPDGKRHTDDDVELGPVDATWSMKIFYESEDARTDLVGSVSPSGFFTPALDSPQNNFDVWVVAEAKTDRDQDGQPLVGKAYLVITVPFYVFNGRRYVRDLDHWVDDGPAMPAPRENR